MSDREVKTPTGSNILIMIPPCLTALIVLAHVLIGA